MVMRPMGKIKGAHVYVSLPAIFSFIILKHTFYVITEYCPESQNTNR